MTTPTIASLRQTSSNFAVAAQVFFIKAASLLPLLWPSRLCLSAWWARGWSPISWALSSYSDWLYLRVLLITAWFLRLLRLRHTDDRIWRIIEDHIPDLEQRLLTSLEFNEDDLKYGRAGVSQQFIQQLWEDAQTHVAEQQRGLKRSHLRSDPGSLATAVTVVSVISAMFLNSESLLKSGARLAWPFAISEPLAVAEFLPEIEISVEPGDLELQRGNSVTIIARVSNATPDSIDLRLQDDNVNWQAVSMSRDGSGSNSATYSYFIPSLQVDTTYYVALKNGDNRVRPNIRLTCSICHKSSKSIWRSIILTTPS